MDLVSEERIAPLQSKPNDFKQAVIQKLLTAKTRLV